MSENRKSCSVQYAMQLIGGKWKLVILWNLLNEPKRFNELKRTIGQISTKVLSDQLSQMEEGGLITRHAFPTSPPQVEYRITQKGRELSDSLCSIHDWGEKYRNKVTL
jgi:DNA-binding HxlR family transcriptional regulator